MIKQTVRAVLSRITIAKRDELEWVATYILSELEVFCDSYESLLSNWCKISHQCDKMEEANRKLVKTLMLQREEIIKLKRELELCAKLPVEVERSKQIDFEVIKSSSRARREIPFSLEG